MSKPTFKTGDTFKAAGQEFEVATISTNEASGVHQYEILLKSDMDARREADAKSARQAAKEAEADRKAREAGDAPAVPALPNEQ